MSAAPDSTLADPEQRIPDLERQHDEYKAKRDEALQTGNRDPRGIGCHEQLAP